MTSDNERDSLTAAQLIEKLSALPADTIITTSEHDSEWGISYLWGISGVDAGGALRHGNLIGADSDFERF